MDKIIKLYGRIFIRTTIEALTGLHIGGSSSGMEIGGIDNPVIRDPVTKKPYIPGSSLRGKMRSQLEKSLGLVQNNRIGQVTIHTCKKDPEYSKNGGCPVCHIFGVPGETKVDGPTPTLLVVRDAPLSDDSATRLEAAHTDLPYGELKTEVTIDRVTSAAVPRSIERVPAGTEFSPAELVFSIYCADDFARLKQVLDGLQLVEDDYLGGSGSRGSGKVCFKNIKVTARASKNYSDVQEFGEYATLQKLSDVFSDLETWAKEKIKIKVE